MIVIALIVVVLFLGLVVAFGAAKRQPRGCTILPGTQIVFVTELPPCPDSPASPDA